MVKEVPQPTPPKTDSALIKMRKVHSEFDRKRREFKAVLASSAGNDTTRGTPTENALMEAIAEGEKLDQNLMDMEAS